jgi:hypothetical protein
VELDDFDDTDMVDTAGCKECALTGGRAIGIVQEIDRVGAITVSSVDVVCSSAMSLGTSPNRTDRFCDVQTQDTRCTACPCSSDFRQFLCEALGSPRERFIGLVSISPVHEQ